MDRDCLQRWQAERLRDAVAPMRSYLRRLRERMDKTGFPSGDPLYQAACDAHDALQALWVNLHYLSCGAPTWDGYPNVQSPGGQSEQR
jgi:hypothetical protein